MIRGRTLPFRIFVAVSLFAVAGYVVFRAVISHRLGVRLAAIGQAGEPMTLQDLNRIAPILRPEDNGATAYRKAFEMLEVGDYTGNNTAYFGILARDPVAGPPNPEALAHARFLLAARVEYLALLAEAARKEYCNFNEDYRLRAYGAIDRSRFLGLMHSARLLQSLVYVELADNHPEAALRAFDDALRLTDAIESEPTLDSYLVRTGMLQTMAGTAARIVDRVTLTPATMDRLRQAFTERLARTDVATAVNGERCLGTIRFLVPVGREEALFTDAKGLNPLFTIPLIGDRMDVELLQYLDMMGRYRDACRQFGTNRLRDYDVARQLENGLPPLQLIHTHRAEFEAAMEVTMIGLGIEAQRMRTGEVPTELPTTYTASVLDPFGDGRRQYGFLRLKSAVRIYSIGRDQVDEAGIEHFNTSGLTEFRGGDIAFVLRLPEN